MLLTRNKKLLLALPLAVLGLLGGCAEEKPKLADQTDTDTRLVAYLQSQLDKENVEPAPASSYTDYATAETYRETQRQLWELWQRANADRLKLQAWQIDSPMPLVWKLPQSEEMQYRLLAKGAKPAGGYPFFINLHGGGRYPTEPGPWTSEINNEEWYTLLSFTDSYPNSPALYFVPRMSDDRKGRWHPAPQRMAFRRAIQLAILRGDADPDRIYLTGISEGGYGAFRLALYMPDYFTAIGSLAAAIEKLELAENLRHIPFRFDVGEQDYEYNRSLNAMDWREKLEELATANPGEFVHQANILPGRGHTIPYLTITPWLAGYTKREVYPKHLSYTYYNIDDGFSEGVYYLGFGELRPSKDARLHLDVHHEGNTFKVKTELRQGIVHGSLTLYIDEVDFSQPITVEHNGKEVFRGLLRPSKGVMAEAVARFGDPKRIFPAKVSLPL